MENSRGNTVNLTGNRGMHPYLVTIKAFIQTDYFNILAFTDLILKNDSTPDGGDIEDDADVCFGLPTRILYDLSIQRMHQLTTDFVQSVSILTQTMI